MMSLAIFAIVVGIALHAWDRFKSSREPTFINWKLLANIEFPAELVRDASVECFGSGQRRWIEIGSVDCYQRGDTGITRVSNPRSVNLADIPSLFSVCVCTIQGKTEVTIRIDILSNVRMRRWAAKYFDNAAETELMLALDRLRQATIRLYQERMSQARATRERPAQEAVSDVDADYALFGLKRGASLEQVQKAYRIACRKYHPDRLTGQNVEPHLVELAVQRFKEVAAAYQRIKERHPQAA